MHGVDFLSERERNAGGALVTLRGPGSPWGVDLVTPGFGAPGFGTLIFWWVCTPVLYPRGVLLSTLCFCGPVSGGVAYSVGLHVIGLLHCLYAFE